MMTNAQAYCSRNSSVTVSAEKVEKVVNPPRKLVMAEPCLGWEKAIMMKILDCDADKITSGQVGGESAQGKGRKQGV